MRQELLILVRPSPSYLSPGISFLQVFHYLPQKYTLKLMGSVAQYLRAESTSYLCLKSLSTHYRVTLGLMERLLEIFKLYLDRQSLIKKDDAVCSRLKLGGDDS
ncbi:unnamed protein product [Spirodela intermedia]|uniref:Uncharacterized protein n=1 Tax=Spirodela intermedia TaxID=51605 RepID=A0A7I8KSQ0_SPIIN|nr:unnamed protein product [Spirodela intermedia]